MPKTKLTNFLLALLLVFLIVNASQFTQFKVLAQGNGQAWLNGWAYREQLTIQNAAGAGTNYQIPITVYQNANNNILPPEWYTMSAVSYPISGNPTDQHGFDVVHTTDIVQCNIVVDGATRTYLAYDSDSEGNLINLYYTNSLTGTWTPYSGNPILGGDGDFRTPSVALVGGTFYMFLNNINNKDVELWTSTNGITFTESGTILTTNYDEWTAPFVWLNPNNNNWYLFWTQGDDSAGWWETMARTSSTITGFSTQSDTTVMNVTQPYNNAFPSIMYRNGYYWLLTEAETSYDTGLWRVNAWYSKSPTSGYSLTSNSPIATDDEACPEIFIADNGVSCYLFTNQNQTSVLWYQEMRTVGSSSPSAVTSVVTTNGHCLNNFGDIRFTASDGVTLLNYWMQDMYNGANATFWVQDPDNLSNSNSTIYMYYGNSQATTTSNGKNTFELFDNFSADSSIDWTNTWQSSQQSLYSLSGGQLVCSQASAGSQLIQTQTSFSGGFCVESLVKETNSRGQAYMDMEQNTETYTGHDIEILDWYGYYGTTPTFDIFLGGTANIQSCASDTTDFFTLVEKCPSSGTATGEIWLNGALQFTATGTPSYTNAHVGFLDWDAGTAQVSLVLVRKYVNPEPSLISVGNEQTETPSAPTVSVSPSSWTMDVGQSETFSATPSGGSGSYSGYQWYVNGVAQTSQTGSTYSFAPVSPGVYSITATVTDSSGATSAQSSPATVTVAASPTVSVAPVGPLAMDVGQVQTFTATVTGGSGTINYQWYLDGTAVGSNSASYSYTAAGTSHSVTCKVTDSASIPVTSPASNAVTITVAASPTVSISPGSATLDVGQSATFAATASGGSGSLSFQWYVNSVLQSASTSSFTYAASATGTFTIYVQVTDSASTPVTVKSNSATVQVNSALVAPKASASPATVTQGQTSRLTSTAVTTGTSPYSYQWYSKAPGASSYSAISGATSSSYSFVTSSSTATGTWSFELKVTDHTGASVTSNVVTVTVSARTHGRF